MVIQWSLPLIGLVNKRIRKFNYSRKHNNLIPKFKSSFWFHCASLGEYEESKPIINHIQRQHPSIPIVISFFSDSGFDIIKEDGANPVFYLPFDRFNGYKSVFDSINPIVCFISKYEFWFGLIDACQKRSVPIIHINTTIHQNSSLLRFPRKLFSNQLRDITHYFTSDKVTKKVLEGLYIKQVTEMGDLRILRALETKHQVRVLQWLENWKQKPIIVWGSTWPEDEKIIMNFFSKYYNFQHVIAPHNISESHIRQLQTKFPNAQLYSNFDASSSNKDIVIIDCIGILKYVYRYGDYAYIGGGQHSKVHNFLEAAVYNIPVFLGPKHQNMPIAQRFLDGGLAFEVSNAQSIYNTLTYFTHTRFDRRTSKNFFGKYANSIEEQYNTLDGIIQNALESTNTQSKG